MTTSIRVYSDADYSEDPDVVLYVERDKTGPLLVIPTVGYVRERFRLPENAVELLHPDDAVAHVLELIADVEMPKKVREAIAEQLGVDGEDVGTAPTRKAS